MLVKAADLKLRPKSCQSNHSQSVGLGPRTSYACVSRWKNSRAIQLILGGIGAVSLLVAAIGIANTMVMSVTERTARGRHYEGAWLLRS